jgi:YHS domain-containing protein
MTFLARILRYVFWVLVVSWAVAILRRIVRRMAVPATKSQPDVDLPNDEVARKLVRDPVCGMHIAEVLAIPHREGGALVHFCSADCRDKYLSSAEKIAANG